MSNTTHDSTSLNQAAAHDTGLYDPAVHDNQIVALYETDAGARTARQTLLGAGFPDGIMQVMDRSVAGMGTPASEAHADEGVWSMIKNLFVPDEDRTTYNTAIARGHAMLVVTPTRSIDRKRLVEVLETTNPLDFDAKLEEWRQAAYDTTGQATTAPTSNTATGGHAVDAGLNTGLGGPVPAAAPAPTPAPAGTAAMSQAPGNDSIKVLEERLRVGKREVSAGAVRIRSYIVERPVEASIRLREENVAVERRPVDRAATPADMAAFQERTIEARATSEEAVISKEARVVEEIGLNKQVTDRTEVVHDTVRKTEVEVEGDSASKVGSLSGTPNHNPNATPGATTSGANAPRK